MPGLRNPKEKYMQLMVKKLMERVLDDIADSERHIIAANVALGIPLEDCLCGAVRASLRKIHQENDSAQLLLFKRDSF